MNFNTSLHASVSQPLEPMEAESTKKVQKRKFEPDALEEKSPVKGPDTRELDKRITKKAKALTINETVEFLTTPFSMDKMTISLVDDDDKVDALTLLGLD